MAMSPLCSQSLAPHLLPHPFVPSLLTPKAPAESPTSSTARVLSGTPQLAQQPWRALQLAYAADQVGALEQSVVAWLQSLSVVSADLEGGFPALLPALESGVLLADAVLAVTGSLVPGIHRRPVLPAARAANLHKCAPCHLNWL